MQVDNEGQIPAQKINSICDLLKLNPQKMLDLEINDARDCQVLRYSSTTFNYYYYILHNFARQTYF